MEDVEMEDGVVFRFKELCNNGGLSKPLNQDMFLEAAKLLKESLNLDLVNEETEKYWFGFILYSVKRLSEKSGGGLALCQILKAIKVNMEDFFKEMPNFVVKAGPIMSRIYGKDWEKRLEAKELQGNLGSMSFLRNSYKNVYQDFFLASEGDKYHRFGWLLFLAIRTHAFSKFKELVSCTNGLVSVLAVLILHVPIRFRNFSIVDSPRFVIVEGKCVDLIASLCKIYNTPEDDLRRTIEKANDVVVSILKKKSCLASECKAETLRCIKTDGLLYFEDLMEEESLSSSLVILEKGCEEVTVNREEEMSEGSAKRKFDAVATPAPMPPTPVCTAATPSPMPPTPVCTTATPAPMPPTPVCTTMTATEWLKTIPSSELEHFLFTSGKDKIYNISHRVHIILEAIFPRSALGESSLQSANLLESIWAERRRLEAKKLYHNVLEAVCTAEANAGRGNNLASLFSNETFHRSMLACSAELVLATDKRVPVLFPVVLERTGITAYDFIKVIESFIRYEESLPRELRRHLNSLEERLLESSVWEKGSSLYNSLILANPSLSKEITGLLAEPMPSLDTIATHYNISSKTVPSRPSQNGDMPPSKRMCTAPLQDPLLAFSSLKSKLLSPSSQSTFASPARQNPKAKECAEKGIKVFFSKVLKLVAVRINGLVERLKMERKIRETVYCLVQQILCRKTNLFFNRHIDQIILCSFYAVAKASQINLTFEQIVCTYKKQPQYKPHVYRSVFVDWSLSTRHNGKIGQEHVGMIQFYNAIFIPSVHPLLKELDLSGANPNPNPKPNPDSTTKSQDPGSPHVSSFPSLPDMSPKKVSEAFNVYVSPLRQSKKDALISYSSKSHYAFVGESTKHYETPSRDLSDINSRLTGKKVNRSPSPNDSGLISDAFVSESLYHPNGDTSRLAGMYPSMRPGKPKSES
ncbi:Retinoblastoma-related protein 1 [Ranunculus cassubicifolius]